MGEASLLTAAIVIGVLGFSVVAFFKVFTPEDPVQIYVRTLYGVRGVLSLVKKDEKKYSEVAGLENLRSDQIISRETKWKSFSIANIETDSGFTVLSCQIEDEQCIEICTKQLVPEQLSSNQGKCMITKIRTQDHTFLTIEYTVGVL